MSILNYSDSAGVVAVVPMKPLSLSKSRLSDELDSDQRAALAIGMFANVVTAAVESAVAEIWVIGGDDQIRDYSDQLGGKWVKDGGAGLNQAVSESMKAADVAGMHTLYLPADLPFLQSSDIDALLEASAGGSKLTFAPAQRDGGTNAMLVPARSGFHPLLGNDSFRRHRDLASELGMPFAVCDSPGFALDLDTPSDLSRCQEIEPGFLQRLTGRSDLSTSLSSHTAMGTPRE